MIYSSLSRDDTLPSSLLVAKRSDAEKFVS